MNIAPKAFAGFLAIAFCAGLAVGAKPANAPQGKIERLPLSSTQDLPAVVPESQERLATLPTLATIPFIADRADGAKIAPRKTGKNSSIHVAENIGSRDIEQAAIDMLLGRN